MEYTSVKWSSVNEGDALPEQSRDITRTTVVSTAIASRDFQNVHHDHDAATKSGTKDIFLNILTTGGLIGKYLTDWSGPEGELKRIAIKLAMPCYPGDTLVNTGSIVKKYEEDGKHLIDVQYTLTTAGGPHAMGTATLVLPD